MAFSVAARYVMKEGAAETVLSHLARVRQESLKEPGCVSYEPHRSVDDENVVFIIEKYETEDDFDHHVSTDHFIADVLGKVVPLLVERTVTKGRPAF